MTTRIQLIAPALTVAMSGLAFGQDECSTASAAVAGVPTAFDTFAATTSVEPWPCALGGIDLWYSYTPTMTGGSVTVDLCGSSYDTAIEAFSGTCGALTSIGCNDDSCGLQSTLSFGPTAAGTPLYFRIGGYNGASGTGTYLLTENPPGMGQDECTGAVALTAGASTPFDTSGATTSFPGWTCAAGGNDLWFSYTSTTAGGSQIRVETCGSSYDTAIEIFSGSCAAQVLESCNDDACALQSVATASSLAAGTQYFIRVGGYNGAAGPGTVLVTEGPDPCAADAFEPNTDCASAVPLGDGVYPGLNVQDGDNDYYAVGLDPGATLTVDIFFLDAIADTDLYLWDPLVACDTNVAGQGSASGALAVGFSTSDDEQVVYTNTTGAPQALIVEVDMFSSGGCNTYDLQIAGSNGMGGGLGTNYCDANNTSTGAPGTMSAAGSRVAAKNDVTLTAADLPTNSFAFFLASTTQGFVPNPGGSQGNLCVSGAIGRYVGPGQIQHSGAAGEVSLVLDLTVIPQPNGFVPAMPGDTWNFTCWFRDANPGPTSNFTDGISIVFI